MQDQPEVDRDDREDHGREEDMEGEETAEGCAAATKTDHTAISSRRSSWRVKPIATVTSSTPVSQFISRGNLHAPIRKTCAMRRPTISPRALLAACRRAREPWFRMSAEGV